MFPQPSLLHHQIPRNKRMLKINIRLRNIPRLLEEHSHRHNTQQLPPQMPSNNININNTKHLPRATKLFPCSINNTKHLLQIIKLFLCKLHTLLTNHPNNKSPQHPDSQNNIKPHPQPKTRIIQHRKEPRISKFNNLELQVFIEIQLFRSHLLLVVQRLHTQRCL